MKTLTVTKSELLVGNSDQEFRRFIHDFMAFSSRLIGIRTRLAESVGLQTAAYSTLVAIAFLAGEETEEVGVNQVAECLYVSGSFITTEVNKLVKAGLIQKRIDFKDRRRVLLIVTDKGKKMLARLAPMQAKVNNQLFSNLSAGDFKRLRNLLKEFITCADRAHLTMDLLVHSSADELAHNTRKTIRRSSR